MNTSNWEWFKLSDLFDLKKGKRLTKADMIGGDIPYIGASDSHNGVTAYISNDEHLHSANTITVSYNGSIAEAYYQTSRFWATDDVNVLYPKFSLNKYNALFLTTIINREKYRFNYGRKWDIKAMSESVIKLPVNANGNPDWKWIEDYVKIHLLSQLPSKTRNVWNNQYDTTPINRKQYHLTDREWRNFKYDDVFKILKGFYNKKPDHIEKGEVPFIGATDSNNGITSTCTRSIIEETSKTGDDKNAPIEEKLFKANCITVSNNGSVGYAFFQPKEFTCTHDVNPLYLKDGELNVYIAMFLCTIIEKDRFRWAYGRKWRPKRMPSSIIRLPVAPNTSTPDWKFMEEYIKSLPYSSDL